MAAVVRGTPRQPAEQSGHTYDLVEPIGGEAEQQQDRTANQEGIKHVGLRDFGPEGRGCHLVVSNSFSIGPYRPDGNPSPTIYFPFFFGCPWGPCRRRFPRLTVPLQPRLATLLTTIITPNGSSQRPDMT